MKTKKQKPKKCKKKLVKKFRVTIDKQHRDFNYQGDARAHARDILEKPIFFLNLEEVEVEEEDC